MNIYEILWWIAQTAVIVCIAAGVVAMFVWYICDSVKSLLQEFRSGKGMSR